MYFCGNTIVMKGLQLFWLLCVSIFVKEPIFSQEEKPISTAFSFLLLNSDAISAGKGEVGVASAPDVFSQRVNASKYIFLPTSSVDSPYLFLLYSQLPNLSLRILE